MTGDDLLKVNFWRNKNIDMTGLDSCRKLLLRKLIDKLSGNPLGKILAKMDRANNNPTDVDKFKIRYWIKPLNGSSGRTDSLSYDPATGIFSASITLDSTDVAEATELYIVGTIVHETIHAYMKSLLYRAFSGMSLTSLQTITYDSAFNQYVNLLASSNQAQLNIINIDPQHQHNYMANKLLSLIAEAYRMFDGNVINDDRYYWFMAWKGLYQSDPWKTHWPNYPTEPIVGAPYTSEDSTRGLKYALTPARLDSITTAIRAESHSYPDAKGRPPLPGGCY